MKKRREMLIKYLFVLMCLLALTACGQAGSIKKTIPEETPSVYVETIGETEPQEIVTIVEELEGVRIVQTGPSLPYSDGYEDILYYTGYTSGSGGSWDLYYLLRWSEEKQEYESIELPWCYSICYEDHKLHSISIDTPARQYYSIYGLQNGEYQEEKELALLESISDDDTCYPTAYSPIIFNQSGKLVSF